MKFSKFSIYPIKLKCIPGLLSKLSDFKISGIVAKNKSKSGKTI